MNLQNIDSKGFRSADLNTKQGDNINIESLQKIEHINMVYRKIQHHMFIDRKISFFIKFKIFT